jgi:hypothetical protein
MTEDLHKDLHMDDVENASPLHEAPELSTPFTAANTAADAATDGSHSLNGSGPSTPIHLHEDVPSTFADLEDAKSTIFRPYDIEEPDDEPEPIAQRPELPCLPDSFERWQRDLTEWMDGMNHFSDKKSTVKIPPGQRRGQKRKSPSISGTGHVQSSPSHRSKSKAMLDDQRAPVPGLSPKRRRRRSKPPEDASKATRTTSLYDFRETGSTGSSSSDLQSSDASSTDTLNEFALTDEMDID